MRKRAFEVAAWVVVPSLWLAIVAWAFIEWRRDGTSGETLLTTVFIVGVLSLFGPSVRLTKALLARRAKAQQTYRPTRLGS